MKTHEPTGQTTFNQVVDGSIPSRLTNKIGHLSKELFWQYLTGRKLVAVQVLCRPHYANGPNRSINSRVVS